jgi:hypothetical protein
MQVDDHITEDLSLKALALLRHIGKIAKGDD